MTNLKFLFLDSLLSGSLGGPLAKVWCIGIQGISAQLPGEVHQPQLDVLVFKACLLNSPGGPSAKVCSSAKYEHTSKLLLNNFQCNCLQEIHSHFGGSSAKVDVCQVWCSGIQGIYSRLGGPSAKVGLSANFGVLVFKASLLYYPGGSIGQR